MSSHRHPDVRSWWPPANRFLQALRGDAIFSEAIPAHVSEFRAAADRMALGASDVSVTRFA